VKKLDRLQREDAERIADLAGFDHGEGLDQRQPLHPQFFAWFGSRRALREIPCQKSDELLVDDRIGELALYHFLPSRGAQAGFLGKLARRRRLRIGADEPAAFGNLPAVGVEREAILADQIGVHFAVDRHDADALVLEVDGPIDAGLARGIDHFVMRQANPAIVIDLLPGDDLPRSPPLSHACTPSPRPERIDP